MFENAQNFLLIQKLLKKLATNFSIFKIIAFELLAGISLIYDENTCDRQSTYQKTVPRFPISLRENFSNSISPRLMENWDKSAGVQFSAVCETREHFDSGTVF